MWPEESIVTVSRGRDTLEGHGGVPVIGTSIVSGDASGHWQITSNILSVSAIGEGNLEASYGLLLDTGQVIDVTLVTNEFSVETGVEVAAVAASASVGKTIRILASASEIEIVLNNLTKTDLTITGVNGHSVRSAMVDTCTGIILDGLRIKHDNSTGSDRSSSRDSAIVVDDSSITINNSTFDCGPAETPGAQQTTAALQSVLVDYMPMDVQL